MHIAAAALSILMAVSNVPVIQTFVDNIKAGRGADAYAQMSAEAQKTFARTQFDAYIASRVRALGPVVGVDNVRRAEKIAAENGVVVYEADVRFEKGTSPSWFVLAYESAAWRVVRFGLDMPEGKRAVFEPKEMLPIVHELLASVKSDGAITMAARFSKDDLAEVGQTLEVAQAAFLMTDDVLGRLKSYTIGAAPTDESADCLTARGQGTFEHGDARMTVRLCWKDGVWRLRHADLTALLTPAVVERSVAFMLRHRGSAECPHDAEFPVNGTIVCRVTQPGKPPQNATIKRTSESGWEVVAIEEIRK